MIVTVDRVLGTSHGITVLLGTCGGARVAVGCEPRTVWPVMEAVGYHAIVMMWAERWQWVPASDPRPPLGELGRDLRRRRQLAGCPMPDDAADRD